MSKLDYRLNVCLHLRPRVLELTPQGHFLRGAFQALDNLPRAGEKRADAINHAWESLDCLPADASGRELYRAILANWNLPTKTYRRCFEEWFPSTRFSRCDDGSVVAVFCNQQDGRDLRLIVPMGTSADELEAFLYGLIDVAHSFASSIPGMRDDDKDSIIFPSHMLRLRKSKTAAFRLFSCAPGEGQQREESTGDGCLNSPRGGRKLAAWHFERSD